MAQPRRKLTAREQQSRRVAKEKARRKWARMAVRRVKLWSAVAVAAWAVIGGGWFWMSGRLVKTVDHVEQGAWMLTANAGFAVRNVYLEGRSRTPLTDIRGALAVSHGSPILALDMGELRERLEKLPHVKQASIDRALPDTLYVRIVERAPVALWQHDSKVSLVDDEGTVMEDTDIAPYHALPLVVGDGAPKHVHELLAMLGSEPDLMKQVKAAVRVGDRRWNLHLAQGIEVKLPEQGESQAWKDLAQLSRERRLLDRNIKAVDMRAPDRVFIRLSPDAGPAIKTSAKET
jgi:cell division protein FtsQ